jgi:hypothetical protein
MTPDELSEATSLRVLVTGGRNYQDDHTVNRVLESIHRAKPIAVLIHGNCSGADDLAARWAFRFGVPCAAFSVRFELDGHWPGAGPRRNSRMLEASKPDIGVAFAGGNGTADMVRKMTVARLGIVCVDASGGISLRGPAVRLHGAFFGKEAGVMR